VVISASHNPPEYNGIKFFDADGFKLSQELEDDFEERLHAAVDEASAPVDEASAPVAPVTSVAPIAPVAPTVPTVPTGTAVGTTIVLEQASECYIEHAVAILRSQGIDLAGLRVVVDCGHGASSVTTPEALRRLGATLTELNTDFNGNEINVGCGSTCLDQLKAQVLATGADIGIAHDGDADRMLAIDEQGRELDGDIIEAICALDLKAQGRLAHDTVVSTVLCNLGFIKAMRKNGIEVVQTAVGDNHVLAAMRKGGFVIGGEQSGHTILLEHNSTGDGLVSALQLLAAMRRSGISLGHLARVMTRYPQTLINVRDVDREGLDFSTAITQAVREAEERLGEQGRVLIRASGTEPLIRVMVEAADEGIARDEAQALASLVKQELG
jgi:phosphoglucosamine mutase